MSNDSTKRAYEHMFSPKRVLNITSLPKDGMVNVPLYVSTLNIAIAAAPLEDTTITVTLPIPRAGKSMQILFNCGQGDYSYRLSLRYQSPGSQWQSLDAPAWDEDQPNTIVLFATDDSWFFGDSSITDTVRTIWNMATQHYSDIIGDGGKAISTIYEEEDYHVPANVSYIQISATEDVESKNLKIILPSTYLSLNRLVVVSCSLLGSAPHRLVVDLAGTLTPNIPNGRYVLYALGDVTSVQWLPIASIVDEA